MNTVVAPSIQTDPTLDFIHFQGVVAPSRVPRLAGQLTRPLPCAQARQKQQVHAARPEKLDEFVVWLLECAGLRADAYRVVPLHRRLPAMLRLLRVRSTKAARGLLEAKPELLPAALDAVLIGVTSFFRDTRVFEYLDQHTLPSVLRSRARVRVVSAGTSNGCELYSVAILLAESGALQGSSLIGIDCRPQAIELARLGCFSPTDLGSIKKVWHERYFQNVGTALQADVVLRQAIRWHCADLLNFQPPACDLMLFRNVAIYFDERSAELIWERLCSALTPGGFLITGKAEKPPRHLPLQCIFPSVYQKKDAAP